MTTDNLTFTKNIKNRWESRFVSSGERVVVQLQADLGDEETSGEVVVYANLSDMPPVVLGSFDRSYSGNYLFEVDVPESVEVIVESMREVISGKITN